MSALPRDVLFQLNRYELGWLRGAISSETMQQMKKECPVLWLQIELETTNSYAKSDGHPAQEVAKAEVKKLKKALVKKLTEEKEQ